ncbi:hypothetical protein H257_14860 [Aphanomyces astaci]|uniref:Tc1-like transposase DDE domain-containing protein n=1 Tax=Aphanomyces astaci TaxID=112090 RepID=W4FS78_APHAT|nr:hypothetical protein H257_14860 [Aphanomyces astaci]ETV69493.1 hypothetical protein H257_14860 [Aphanomyces astaci]|eukprot:XP_009841066.1 hypothetical protein H257_14860 [Aphanomyces astaci]
MVNQAPSTRKDVSSSKKAEVIQQLYHFLVNGKLVRGAFKRTAEMLDIERRSVAYIWDTFCTPGTLKSNKCAKVGPNPKYSPDDIRNLVRDVPMDQRSTTRDISTTTGLSRGTLSRHLKIGTFVRRSTRIKPLLTDANKAERTAFCGLAAAGEAGLPETVEFEILWDVVHLNEKCRPRFDHDRGVLFDGKVGMWPVVESVPAVRNSRNRPADYIINKVIPAIKASFPSANKRVVLQHDNATPHASITDAELEAVSTDGWKFVLRRQPPNSPDLNALDLGFFASIQSLQYKSMSRTVYDVIRSTLAAFEELSFEKLESVFFTFQSVMRLILEHDGGNHYVLPHLKKAAVRRAGLLMQNVSCPVSLLL